MDWKRYLWEAFHYDRWGRARLSSAPGSFTGLSMLLGNLNRGHEQYPLANVHLPIGQMSREWSLMSEEDREAVTESLCRIIADRGDELRRCFEDGDRSGFYSVATRVDEKPNDEKPNDEKPKRRKKKEG